MKKYICIHGHFYQPPRENPWLRKVKKQPSADPFHDWNERITAECYEPNLSVEDDNSFSNASRMSFNFGPTLLAWMRQCNMDVYQKIITADQKSRECFSGFGSAIAQGYNHIIMPLASQADKYKQIAWAIDDFKQTYNRFPAGMWLPETAVDTATLEMLAEQNIQFTILAPHQVDKIKSTDGMWEKVSQETLDTTRPYLYRLPSGRTIVIFYYNGSIASDIAFGSLLHSADDFYNRVCSMAEKAPAGGLLHWAVDGETYGHHNNKGHCVLAEVLNRIEANDDLILTNYEAYLDHHPAVTEVTIKENSSWSCMHGVGRWCENCGCVIDAKNQGHQEWREPLRKAMNWLRDEVNAVLAEAGDISNDQKEELICNSQYMFTSCGWFFDHFKRIETQQIIQYAVRVMETVENIAGRDLMEPYLDQLHSIKDAREVCLAIKSKKDIIDYEL